MREPCPPFAGGRAREQEKHFPQLRKIRVNIVGKKHGSSRAEHLFRHFKMVNDFITVRGGERGAKNHPNRVGEKKE